MEVIKLKGKTLKGRNRINELGELWVVVKIRQFPSYGIPEGSLLVIPFAKRTLAKQDDLVSRWVIPVNDPNFEIVERNIDT